MALSLYDVSVTSFLQTVGAVSNYLEKAKGHFAANGQNPDDILSARVHDDMLPFTFQIASVAHHSAGAIAGAKSGEFRPPGPHHFESFAACQAHVAEALAALKAATPEEINALEGRDMAFILGERRMPFTVEGFLLSFSTPNLHFHATVAYGLLRSRGAPLGKRDYMGQMRLKA